MRAHIKAAALAAALLGACSFEPLIIRGAELGPPAPSQARRPGLPVVVVERPVDARPTASAGLLGGRPTTVTGIDAFLESMLIASTSPTFDTVRADDPALAPEERPALRVRSRLLKAYVHSLSTSRAFVVVVEATFSTPDGAATVRTFRGQDVGVNWVSGAGDVVSGLRGAAQSCADQIRVTELELLGR